MRKRRKVKAKERMGRTSAPSETFCQPCRQNRLHSLAVWTRQGKDRHGGSWPSGRRPGTGGADRFLPREHGQRSGGGVRGETNGFVRKNRPCRDILNSGGPLVEIGPVRSFPIRLSVDGSSQRGKVCGRPELAGPDIVGRGAWGETESKGANHLSQVPESGWTLPLSASIPRPDRGKPS